MKITVRVKPGSILPPLVGNGIEPQFYYKDAKGVLRGSVTYPVCGEPVVIIETSAATAAFLQDRQGEFAALAIEGDP